MFGKNASDSLIMVKILVITGLILVTLCLTTAEASISDTRELTFEMTNELIEVPGGLSIPIDISAEITGTIEVSGPGGYTWIENISGPGSSTYSHTLGPTGTYTVTESYETVITGTPTGFIGSLLDPVTQTYDASAIPWTFNTTTDGAVGSLEVTSAFGNISVSEHSDNISISISGISFTVTATQVIKIGDTFSATISGQVTVDTFMTLLPAGGGDPASGPAELVAYWNFDEGQGAVVHDTVGNNDGMINGIPMWVEGYLGGGLELDGTTDYVDCGADASLDITEAITVAAWIKADTFQNWGGIVVKGVDSSSFAMQVWGDGALRFSSNWGILTDAVGTGVFNSDTSMPQGEWVHAAVTHDGSRLRFYINGVLDSEIDQSITFGTNTEPLILGCDFPDGDEYFDGAIDEVRIYNQALTEAAVQLIMGGAMPPEPPTGVERTLSITSAEAAPDSSVTVQLNISDAAGIAEGDVVIRYDASVLTVGEVSNTSLSSGIALIVNKNVPGEIRLGMAGTQGIPSGSGGLVEIEFIVSANAQVGAQTTLQLSEAEMYLASGSAIPVNLEDGVVVITQPGIKGDVNNDGVVRSNDAILVLQISTGSKIPTDYEFWAADMNDDGAVRSNDAILILNKATGLAAPEKGIITRARGRQIIVTMPEAHGVAGERITVPLEVGSADELAGGDVYITYDPAVLRAVDVSSKPDVLLVSNVANPGQIRIAFAGTHRLNSGAIAQIQFEILADDVSPLSFENIKLYNPGGGPLNSRGMDQKFSSWAIPPENNALLQNFPNPFNPETWIPYQLKEDGEVTVRIYNISGSLVRELELGHKSAGLYVSRPRAAYWDGRNEYGERAASDLYFYVMQANGFTAIKKMVVAE